MIFGALALLLVGAVLMPAGAPAGQPSYVAPAKLPQLAAGLYHSCALVDDGAPPQPAGWPVRCWGFSGNGQVGYGNTVQIGDDETPATAGPVDLGAGRTAKALAAGDYHSCALLDNGSVRCWGYGDAGQLGYASRGHIGDDETPGSAGPVSLGDGRTATALTAGGGHTCALLDDGSVRCWGLGENGQLGYGDTASIGDGEQVSSVGPVPLGSDATAITAGGRHTCALLDDASVRCWGRGINGQLGYARTASIRNAGLAAPVDLGAGARAITAGNAHTCAVLDNGSVRCWGLGDHGELGYGNTDTVGDNEVPSSVDPVDLGQGRTATVITAAGNHTCAVLDDGGVRCWGWGVHGQLGLDGLESIGDDETPGSVDRVDLGPGRTATAVAVGIFHACARLDDASVRCWGNGADGRLGLCRIADVGDDEPPSAVGTVDIGFGGQACPVAPPPPPPPPAVPPPPPPVAPPPPPPPPPAAPATPADPAVAQQERAEALRECRAEVVAKARTERAAAKRRFPRGSRQRNLALRRTEIRAAVRRDRCLTRFGRTPGRVTALAARAPSIGRVALTFRAPGSDGSRAPAARRYLVKQSLTPIRTAADFRRAPALCRGGCSFAPIRLGARLTLQIKDLRRRTTYYYAVAARDNVSGRIGPRSATVRVKTR